MTSGRMPVQTDAAPGAIGPYSQAIVAGGFVFTAGQVGIDPQTGELAPGGIAAQAEQAMHNLAAILDAAGTSLDRVVKTTIFLTEIAHFTAVNEIYGRLMPPPHPSRSTVAVRELPKGALVEIECIALDGDG